MSQNERSDLGIYHTNPSNNLTTYKKTHWQARVPTLSLLAAAQVVMMTTFGVISDDKFGIMATIFQVVSEWYAGQIAKRNSQDLSVKRSAEYWTEIPNAEGIP